MHHLCVKVCDDEGVEDVEEDDGNAVVEERLPRDLHRQHGRRPKRLEKADNGDGVCGREDRPEHPRLWCVFHAVQ